MRQRPLRLRPGDRIGIAAPSSPVPRDELESGIAVLVERGYQVEVAPHVFGPPHPLPYLASHDAARADDLNRLFAREDIAAIFCARGGYGATRLLPLLDWPTIAAHPKVFTGYSDITTLHLALARRAGWPTLHGPNVTTLRHLEGETAQAFWRMVEQPEAPGLLPTLPDGVHTLVGGTVEGELAGGCLTLLAHACGSPDAPDFAGKIVLIEDVGEALYRADRYLMQLMHAGLLESAAGFVIGTISGWEKHDDPPRGCTPLSLWQDFFADCGKPVIYDFPFGHVAQPLALPLGVLARLDADAGTLTILDPYVT